MTQGTNRTANLVLVASVVVTLALYFIPFGRQLSYPFLMLSTLAHEMGHGITAWAIGGNFHSFSMWSDGSGVANLSNINSRIGHAMVAVGGLIGPSIAAFLCFILANNPLASRLSLLILGVLLIIAEFIIIKNFFGLLFVGILAGILLVIAQSRISWLAQTSLVFIAIQLCLSVFSRMDYLFTPHAYTSAGTMPSDVALISQALFLPYWFWGALCGILSMLILSLGLWVFVKKS